MMLAGTVRGLVTSLVTSLATLLGMTTVIAVGVLHHAVLHGPVVIIAVVNAVVRTPCARV